MATQSKDSRKTILRAEGSGLGANKSALGVRANILFSFDNPCVRGIAHDWVVAAKMRRLPNRSFVEIQGKLLSQRSVLTGYIARRFRPKSERHDMAKSTVTKDIAAGVAALAICEALLLSLSDLKLMSVKQISDVLDDATAVHGRADASTQDPLLHREIIAHIKRIKSSVQTI